MPETYPDWKTTEISLADFPSSIALPSSEIQYTPIPDPVKMSEVYMDGGRWYSYQGEVYPSITTILKATDDKGTAALKEWRNNVGGEAADAITKKAVARGNKWHNFCESYVKNKPTWSSLSGPGDLQYGTAFANLLNSNITKVIAAETRLFSKQYGAAGRVDLAVQLHDGRLCITDLKGGRYAKAGNRLAKAAIQATFYAKALEEWINEPIETLVIIQLIPNAILWQESSVAAWEPFLVDRIEKYAILLNEAAS
jgi:hypothetical protein